MTIRKRHGVTQITIQIAGQSLHDLKLAVLVRDQRAKRMAREEKDPCLARILATGWSIEEYVRTSAIIDAERERRYDAEEFRAMAWGWFRKAS